MKIGVYSPCKNELKHVDAWYESCKEADAICVTDTGSTDGTRERLSELNINVTDVSIQPWRFDLAFNVAMSLLPSDVDICIRLDMDERLQPGWRQALERAWTPETTRLRYPYVWNWVAPGIPGRQWYSDRIHARKGYVWIGHTHEGLCSRLPEVQTFTDDVKIWQFPDAKNKKGDLALLLESVNEWPHDARLRAYLGREYMYQGQFEKSVETYKEFLAMSWDKIERGQAMVNLSVTDPTNKEFWLRMASIETPGHREPLVNLAQFYYDCKDWQKCYIAAKNALAITVHPMDYTCTPEAWGSQPHDLLSISAWNLGLYQESYEQSKLAMSKSPDDERLQNNFRLVEEFLKEQAGLKTL